MKIRLFLILIIVFLSCKQDEVCFCTKEYKPVCVGDNQYANTCLAKCDGYKDSDLTFLLSKEEIETGILISTDCSL